MITWLSPDHPPDYFPPDSSALEDPPGLLAAGGSLSTERLLAAYHRGIFPWYSPGQPVLWWTPDPREVFYPERLHRSRSLLRSLRRRRFELTRDRDFAATIRACAAPRSYSPGTWITPEMMAAYIRLHELGHAHSHEVWQDGRLVGGLYGVELERVFFAESMFSQVTDASKAALASLADYCLAGGVELIDCQLPSAHLRSLGSQPMPRRQFVGFLNGR